jgi:hypothetical protein
MTDTPIPADVMERARAAADGAQGWIDSVVGHEIIARALMVAKQEERERCAKIAEETTRSACRGDRPDFVLVGPAGLGRCIAAAIRQDGAAN